MKERQNDNYATECANLLAHVEYMRDFVSKRNEIYFPDWGEEIAPKNTDEMTFNFLDTHNESAEKCLKYLVAQYLLRLRPQMYVKYAKLLHKNLATLVNDLKDENKTDYKAAIEATYKELREILVIKKLESAEIEEKGEGINVPELVVFNPKYSKELLRENKEIQEQKKL